MNCPFCGGEMQEGALELRLSPTDELRWVPPGGGGPPEGPRESETEETAVELLKRAAGALTRKPWDAEHAVDLAPHFGKRSASAVLLTGARYLENAWYCPACEKAICVFDRATERIPLESPEGEPVRFQVETLAPEQKIDLPQNDTWVRRDDPWEKKGPFSKQKKPDWEK